MPSIKIVCKSQVGLHELCNLQHRRIDKGCPVIEIHMCALGNNDLLSSTAQNLIQLVRMPPRLSLVSRNQQRRLLQEQISQIERIKVHGRRYTAHKYLILRAWMLRPWREIVIMRIPQISRSLIIQLRRHIRRRRKLRNPPILRTNLLRNLPQYLGVLGRIFIVKPSLPRRVTRCSPC